MPVLLYLQGLRRVLVVLVNANPIDVINCV